MHSAHISYQPIRNPYWGKFQQYPESNPFSSATALVAHHCLSPGSVQNSNMISQVPEEKDLGLCYILVGLHDRDSFWTLHLCLLHLLSFCIPFWILRVLDSSLHSLGIQQRRNFFSHSFRRDLMLSLLRMLFATSCFGGYCAESQFWATASRFFCRGVGSFQNLQFSYNIRNSYITKKSKTILGTVLMLSPRDSTHPPLALLNLDCTRKTWFWSFTSQSATPV